MQRIILTVAALSLGTALQAEGDIDVGKKEFGKCKSCHTVTTLDGDVLVKGGRTGPNLYGVIGRAAGTGDFRYSKTMIEAGEAGLIWDEALVSEFITDPRGFMKAQGTDGKTKMTFKLKKAGADVAAFLASLNPVTDETATD